MPSAVSARSLRCCAIRSLGTAADRPPVSSAPVAFIFWTSISISSGIKRFQPDKMLILVVSSGQRPVLPDVFWFSARSLVFSSVAPQWHVGRRKVRCHSSFPAELGPFSQGRGRPAFRSAHVPRALCSTDISCKQNGEKNGTFLHRLFHFIQLV